MGPRTHPLELDIGASNPGPASPGLSQAGSPHLCLWGYEVYVNQGMESSCNGPEQA